MVSSRSAGKNGFCKRLVSKGFAVIGFVSSLTGQRYHDRSMKEWFVIELRENLSTAVHDVQTILNHLSRRPDPDILRVGIYGQRSEGSLSPSWRLQQTKESKPYI
jgi:dienelactone hydrolase